jgi:hypothetical protein
MRSAVVIALAGCGTYTQYQTAEPLPAGRWQASIADTVGEFFDLAQELPTPTVSAELAVRRGIGNDTDVGLKLYTLGLEASARHRFVTGRWQYAGLAAIGGAYTRQYLGTTEALSGQLRLAGAATRRTGPGFAITLGPALTGSLFVPSGGGWSGGVLAGAFGNVEFSLGENHRWHLTPEVSVHVTVVGDVPVSGAVVMGGLALARDF